MLPGSLGVVQHQLSPLRHTSLLQQNLQERTMMMASRKVGILKVRGFLVPNSHLLDPSELASTESERIRLGPQSVIVTYWAPLSACWALDEMCPAISAPAPIRRPAPSHLVPDFKVPSTVFLGFLESLGVYFFGMNLMLKAEIPLGSL